MNSSSVIKVQSLKPWNVPVHEVEDKNVVDPSCEYQLYSSCKFKVSPDLNQKVYLCQGGIAHLDLDCVVLPFNEMSLHHTLLAQEVHRAAGPLLADYYNTKKDRKTGNVVMESGFDLPARYIIHAMEPGINAKYQTAVETALHRCYRNSLQIAAENNFVSIAFATLYACSDPALSAQMAHVALSTVRCCLEKLRTHFKTVVFSVVEDDVKLYSTLLQAYFPRSVQEAIQNIEVVPSYHRGEWGERVDSDRAIRITDLEAIKPTSEVEFGSNSNQSSECENDCNAANEIALSEVTKHSFTAISDDHDTKRIKEMKAITYEKLQETQERIYRRLLRVARTNDLSQIASTNALYLCGKDRSGSPVVILVSKYIDSVKMDMDKALLYFILMLDSVVNEKYSLVYFHTLSQSVNHPSMKFLRRAYNILDRRYKENLKQLYVIHPTFWSKAFTWFFTTFSANAVKDQVMSIKSIPDLYNFVAPDQIDIPPFIIDYDLKFNVELYRKQSIKQENIDNTIPAISLDDL